MTAVVPTHVPVRAKIKRPPMQREKLLSDVGRGPVIKRKRPPMQLDSEEEEIKRIQRSLE